MVATMKRLLSLAKVAAVVLVAVAVMLGISSWAPDRSVEVLTERWAPPPSKFMPIQGMSVHLRDEGPRDAALTVLLLHGTSASLHTWDGWTEVLAREHRVVRVDLPGFGLTGPFPHGKYDPSSYAEFVTAMLDAIEVPRAVIAGNSFGGRIAWETALAAPERVMALVLVDASSGHPFASQSMPLGFRLAQIPAFGPIMNRLLPRSLVESGVRNVYGDPSLVTEELVDRYYELTLREGNRAALVQRFAQTVPDERASERLAKIGAPTLVLWGREDRLIPLEVAHRFEDDVPDATLAVFDGLGHVPHEEDPTATVAPVLDFLGTLAVRDE
jgi:pimeloyl-ACP methyl ester carboxylesterase